jgi:hypothetical protein
MIGLCLVQSKAMHLRGSKRPSANPAVEDTALVAAVCSMPGWQGVSRPTAFANG